MKALQLLDHVMLWIARIFIALSVGATAYDSFFKNYPALETCVAIAITLLWLICILQFKRLPCRIILGISSLFLLVLFSQAFLPMVGLIAMLWTAIRTPYFQESITRPPPALENSVNSV